MGPGRIRANSNIFLIFHASKLGKLSAFSKFWRRSHQASVLWPNLRWLIHKSITNPSRWISTTQERTCFALIFCVLVDVCAICPGFDNCDERGLAKILRWSYPFSKLLQVTSIWIEAVPKCLVSSERERVKWTRKVLPSSRQTRLAYYIFFPLKFYTDTSCTT